MHLRCARAVRLSKIKQRQLPLSEAADRRDWGAASCCSADTTTTSSGAASCCSTDTTTSSSGAASVGVDEGQ